jgi:autotransporter-associated beta strand protein
VWFETGNECPEGFTYFEIITGNRRCCTCVSDEIVEAEQGPDDVQWCCDDTGAYQANEYGECKQRCCDGLNCQQIFPADCGHTVIEGTCQQGCPTPCCTEGSDGNASCEIVDSAFCTAPKVITDSCETGCLGECCEFNENNELVSLGQTTQADCDSQGGQWGGLGSTTCQGNENCRDPFTDNCCETKQSSAAGMTFTQPRRKRTPPFSDTVRVTVTGTTDSRILIHGTPFGVDADPPKRCPINHSFLLCWDEFNVEPVPCGTDFINVDLTVCWAQEATDTETLNFSGCNGLTLPLGNCPYDCVTTLAYSGSGHTSDSDIVLYGDAVISANGAALVLTSAITAPGSCVEKLTLTGTSTAANQIGVIPNSSSGLAVDKTGSGLWRLTGASTYAGGLTASDGTIVVASTVGQTGASPFGTSVATIGDTAAGISGTAAILIDNGFAVRRGITVNAAGAGSSQVVVLGGASNGSTEFSDGAITLNRSVTLQSASGGSATFSNDWVANGAGLVVSVGSAGNDGTVILDSDLPGTLGGVSVVRGTARLLNADNRINSATPVTFGTATFDRNGQNQTTNGMTVTGTATFIGTGTYTIATTLAGSGSIVHSDGTLAINGTNTMSGSVSILSGSVVVGQIVSGPAGKVTSATFTNTTLTVAFASDPTAGDQYKLLAGSTVQTYTPVLAGTAMTGTYNSATSTLTVA